MEQLPELRQPRSARSRWLWGFTVLLLVGVVVGGSRWWNSRQFTARVERVGGKYYQAKDPTPVTFALAVERILNVISGSEVPVFDVIEFTPGIIDDHWLRDNRSAIAGMSNLTLVMRGSQITTTGLSYLSGLECLHSIDLSDTNLADSSLSHVVTHPNLVNLSIHGTGISDTALAALVQMPHLVAVGIDSTQATYTGITHLAKCPKLEILNLYDANDDNVAQLSRLSGLEFLTLHDAQFSDKSLTSFKSIPKLSLLTFIDCDLSDEHLTQFQTALPACQVQRITSQQIEDIEKALLE